jgi:hypothetical protein
MTDHRTNQAPVLPDKAYAGVLEPGNGSRYEYIVWRVGSQWFAAFPDFGRASRIGAGTNRPDYIREKFHCSNPDAEVMAAIINRCQHLAADHRTTPSMEDFLHQVVNG